MSPSSTLKKQIGRCTCGNVELELSGEPILSASCHCSDCREGSRQIEALPNAAPILDSFGGTEHMVFRKDRVRYLKGQEYLTSLKVDDDSPKRIYTTCCHSYLLMEIPDPMPAMPIFRGRFQGDLPPLQMRINAKFASDETKPEDVPVYRSFPLQFVMKMIGAKVAMILGR